MTKRSSKKTVSFSLQTISHDDFLSIIEWLPLPSFINTCLVSPWFQKKRNEITKQKFGFTKVNEGLLHMYLLQWVLNIRFEDTMLICSHLMREEGQWVVWGDDCGLKTCNSLIDFFFDDGYLLLTDNHEFITDLDEAIGINVSPVLRDSEGRFGSPCYQREVSEALKYRDELDVAEGVDVHSGSCARCGSDKQVFFSADVPTAKGNLCSRCLDQTIYTRFKLQMKHPHACFFTSDDAKSPYSIPPHLKGTKGTRLGLFFSCGAQHSAFGLEFWADPVLMPQEEGSSGSIGGEQESLWNHDNEIDDAPPNAWEIVSQKEVGYRGP
jgi:hypothetical protein